VHLCINTALKALSSCKAPISVSRHLSRKSERHAGDACRCGNNEQQPTPRTFIVFILDVDRRWMTCLGAGGLVMLSPGGM
jgi:hypothetical protein